MNGKIPPISHDVHRENFTFILPDYVDEKTKVSETNTSQYFPNLT